MTGDRPQPALTWYCIRNGGAAQRSGWKRGVSLADLPKSVGAGPGLDARILPMQDGRPIAVATAGARIQK